MAKVVVVVLLLMSLSALAGFYAPQYLQKGKQAELRIPLADSSVSRPISQNLNLGCKGIVEATAQETVFEPKSAIARSGFGSDNAGIRISPDVRSLTILFADDVANGMSEGQLLNVKYPPRDGDTYLVATAEGTISVYSLILNLKTMKAVYSFTGQGMLGIKGWSILMLCH